MAVKSVTNRRVGFSSERVFTPAEFAALFGREKTWTYRLLYAGKINGISDYGRMMIPASEAVRIESEGKRCLGRKKEDKAKKDTPAKSVHEMTPKLQTSGKEWEDWIKEKKRNAGKGMPSKKSPSEGRSRLSGGG